MTKIHIRGALLAVAVLAVSTSAGAAPATMTPDGAVHFASLDVPMPATFSPEARAAFQDFVAKGGNPVLSGDLAAVRKTYDEKWAGPAVEKWKQLLPSKINHVVIAGVQTDVITPAAGVAKGKADRILISLHGGGFHLGNGGPGGLTEAIPMSGYGGYKVVAVDYRQAPEAMFPAATDDVVAVYREILKEYKPEHVGIYGCSAGGMLTAQVVARLIHDKLPLPGAVSIMCSGAAKLPPSPQMWTLTYTGVEINGAPPPQALRVDYFSPADATNPLAFPGNHPEILAKFPPTLVVSSTRDAALSAALDTHARLLEAGVDASLYVRDGLGHGFFAQLPGVPESEATWRAAAKFFDRNLLKK